MIEKPMVVLKCTRCQKDFERKGYRVKKGRLPFCSHSCQVRYGIEKKSKESKVDCTCTSCGGRFEISKAALRRKKKVYGIFCSRKCYETYVTSNDFRTYITLICSVCGREFSRLASIERSNRKSFKNVCCSRACSSKIQHSSEASLKKRLYYQLSQAIRARDKEVGEDVDEDYLLEVWNEQQGRCPYSGQELILKPHRNRGIRIPNQASVDRIDSSLGYIRGNIEFVSLIANMAKNVWSKNDVIEFCKEVTENVGRKNSL